ncbi:MAG: prepilin-type N-terminal cleavage/methylation domain-containing protein [Planctomycetes bacterium]|nr:prepilin-type N-terminal cleavage/methylation domain-containing protein [Planctomycetota bacterium]MCP4861593.1 prepilin-type N-terminal cleavage/methylation domain-containing protein [Planctomycetota bacterium]
MTPLLKSSSRSRSAGFTLLELIIVMVVLGVVAGVSVAGIDRFDPGNRGLRVSIETFLEGSRDRARISGHPVSVKQMPATAERERRLMRFVYRRALEASFEPDFQLREGLQFTGSAAIGATGRFGTCGDLREGGTISIEGRGMPDLTQGFGLDMDIFSELGNGGDLLGWDGFLNIEIRRSGVVAATVRAGDGDFFQDMLLESPADSLKINQWQHLKLVAAEQSFVMAINGVEVARMEIPPILQASRSIPILGNDEDGWIGLVDEFTVWARVGELGPEVPENVEILPAGLPLLFDRNGMLDAAAHASSVPVVILELDEEIGSFVVGRFTQEASL